MNNNHLNPKNAIDEGAKQIDRHLFKPDKMPFTILIALYR